MPAIKANVGTVHLDSIPEGQMRAVTISEEPMQPVQPAKAEAAAPTHAPAPPAEPTTPQAAPAAATPGFLARVTHGRIRRASRILQYGPGGIGKSFQASQIPHHIFIDLEQGTGHLDKAVRFPVAKNLEEVKTQIRELATQPHDFTCLVIDSADRLEALMEDEVSAAAGKQSIDEIGYGKGPGLVASKWQEILAWLTRLWEVRAMHVMVIAHNTVTKFEDPMTASYDKHMIRLGKKSAPVLFEWADLVLFANYRRRTVQEDAGFGNVKTRVLSTEERVWYTQDHPAAAAKSRISIPAEIPMDWNELAKYL